MQSEYDYEDVVVESEAYSEWPNLAGRRENYTTALPHTPASPHAHREKSQGTNKQVLRAQNYSIEWTKQSVIQRGLRFCHSTTTSSPTIMLTPTDNILSDNYCKSRW